MTTIIIATVLFAITFIGCVFYISNNFTKKKLFISIGVLSIYFIGLFIFFSAASLMDNDEHTAGSFEIEEIQLPRGEPEIVIRTTDNEEFIINYENYEDNDVRTYSAIVESNKGDVIEYTNHSVTAEGKDSIEVVNVDRSGSTPDEETEAEAQVIDDSYEPSMISDVSELDLERVNTVPDEYHWYETGDVPAEWEDGISIARPDYWEKIRMNEIADSRSIKIKVHDIYFDEVQVEDNGYSMVVDMTYFNNESYAVDINDVFELAARKADGGVSQRFDLENIYILPEENNHPEDIFVGKNEEHIQLVAPLPDDTNISGPNDAEGGNVRFFSPFYSETYAEYNMARPADGS